jgi:hypothetical protein
VTRQHAGDVKVNNDRFSLLGEHPAFTIAADEEDGNLSGNASTATDPLARHLGNLGKGTRSTDNSSEKSMMANEM